MPVILPVPEPVEMTDSVFVRMMVTGSVLVRMPVEVEASLPAAAVGFVAVAVPVDVAVAASVPASRTVAVLVRVPVPTSIAASRTVVVAVPVDVETPPSTPGNWQVTPMHAKGAPQTLPAQHGWPAVPQATQLPEEQMVSPMQVLPAQQM